MYFCLVDPVFNVCTLQPESLFVMESFFYYLHTPRNTTPLFVPLPLQHLPLERGSPPGVLLMCSYEE